MSAQSSFVSVPSAQVGDAQVPAFTLSHVGSVYYATLTAAADTETKNFAIDQYGRLMVVGNDAENAVATANAYPVKIGGMYNAVIPTYDDGDQAVDQHDVNGRKIVVGAGVDNAAAAGQVMRSGGIYLAALPTYDAGDQVTFQHDVGGRLITNDDQLLTAFNAEDFASETTLAALDAYIQAFDFSTETTLAALLTAFGGTDFATETTLAAVLADTTAILALDFATETTLAALDTYVQGFDFATETTLAAILALDFATETTLAAVLADTTALLALDFATETTLAQLLANVGDSAVLHSIYNDYASSNLPGNATNPLELVASTSAAIRKIQMFDTGGAPCEIMTGAAASETRLMVVGPGVDAELAVAIPAATRVSIRRLDSASALTGGDISINFLS